VWIPVLGKLCIVLYFFSLYAVPSFDHAVQKIVERHQGLKVESKMIPVCPGMNYDQAVSIVNTIISYLIFNIYRSYHRIYNERESITGFLLSLFCPAFIRISAQKGNFLASVMFIALDALIVKTMLKIIAYVIWYDAGDLIKDGAQVALNKLA
jgi:hypothetical protein